MATRIYTFSELDNHLLYAILRLRQQVFVVEQQSIYDDIDNLDQDALHLCSYQDEPRELQGYLRLRILTGENSAKIERVVVARSQRGENLASMMMEAALACAKGLHVSQIGLSAQCDVIRFYHQWGFKEYGEIYDDGGIAHMDMQLNLE